MQAHVQPPTPQHLSYSPRSLQLRLFIFLALLPCLLHPTNSHAIDPRLDWFSLATPHFIIHFPEENEALAELIAERAESAHKELSPWFNWQPKEKTHIVLNTSESRANGSAFAIPYNRIELNMVIPEAGGNLSDFADWWTLLITHEYAHILHLDKKVGVPLFLRQTLGRVPAFYPNLFQPRWIIEGLATYIETDNENQTGRGQSSAFNMMINEELGQGLKSLRQINIHESNWPYSSAYLYGSYFFEFLEQEYGEEKTKAFIAEYSNNIIPFALNTTSSTVFDKSLYSLWKDYEHYLKTNIAIPALAGDKQQALTEKGYLQGPLQSDNDRALLFIQNNGERHTALWKINQQGDKEKITELQSGASFDFHKRGGFIISQAEVCEEYNVYYDLFILTKNDTTPQQITHCAQYHYASWHPSGNKIAAIKINPLYSQIDLLKKDGSFIKTLWKSNKNERLSALDWNQDGSKIITSLHKTNTGWNLYELDTNKGSMRSLTNDWAEKSAPRYQKNGHIIYSADYDGVSNIYKINSTSGKVLKLSQGNKGKFHPLLTEKNETSHLSYMQYGPTGLNIYQQKEIIANAYTVKPDLRITENKKATEKVTPYSPANTAQGYSPWPSLIAPSWIPNFFVSSDQSFIGAILMGADALQNHKYEISLAYEAQYEQLYSNINYQYNDRLFINYEHDKRYFFSQERLDFILNTDQIEAYYLVPSSTLEAQWNILLGGEFIYNSWDQFSPFFIKPDSSRSQLLGVAVLYNSSHRYLRGISDTEGRQVYVAAENIRLFDNNIRGDSLTFDWREYIPLSDAHTLALRGVHARSSSPSVRYFLGDDFSDPFNNIGNIFNRQDYPLRGYDQSLEKLSGNRLFLGSAEWRFPITNIERTLMSPPVGIQKVHGKLFIESGAAWTAGINEREFYSSRGVELIAEARLFYYYPVNLRLGYAKTEEKDGDNFYGSLGVSF